MNNALLATTDAGEALRLHNDLTQVSAQLAEAEERWCELQAELDALP